MKYYLLVTSHRMGGGVVKRCGNCRAFRQLQGVRDSNHPAAGECMYRPPKVIITFDVEHEGPDVARPIVFADDYCIDGWTARETEDEEKSEEEKG